MTVETPISSNPLPSWVPTFDHSTRKGRITHWAYWKAAMPGQRALIGPPPCITCGAMPIGVYAEDDSPRYDCQYTGHDPRKRRRTVRQERTELMPSACWSCGRFDTSTNLTALVHVGGRHYAMTHPECPPRTSTFSEGPVEVHLNRTSTKSASNAGSSVEVPPPADQEEPI